MLPVYEILCYALLGMALASVGFSNVLSMLILRRRFAPRASLAPLQRKIHRSLQGMLVICIVVWISLFLWGATAVARGLMQEQIVPLFFLLFSPLFSGVVSFIFFRKTLRARTREAEELVEELKAHSARRVASARDPGAVEGWSEEWSGHSSQDVRKKALRAVLVLGEPSYRGTLDLLQSLEEGRQSPREAG
jgi:hypothetical protein